MKTFTFVVTRRVTVTIEPEKLEPLMEEFNDVISDFGTGQEALLRHAEHIAFMRATEQCEFLEMEVFEGYGLIRDAGITAKILYDHDSIERDFEAPAKAVAS